MKVLKVLAFVISSLIVFIFGYLYLSDMSVYQSRNTYYFYTKNAASISKSSSVYLNGMRVGYVKDIEFSDETLVTKIYISLRPKLKLNENSEIVINGMDVFYKTLNIELNDGDILKNNSEVKVVDKTINFANELLSIDKIVKNLEQITDNVANMSKNLNKEIEKVRDENLTMKLVEITNKASDLINRVKIPWLFRK